METILKDVSAKERLNTFLSTTAATTTTATTTAATTTAATTTTTATTTTAATTTAATNRNLIQGEEFSVCCNNSRNIFLSHERRIKN